METVTVIVHGRMGGFQIFCNIGLVDLGDVKYPNEKSHMLRSNDSELFQMTELVIGAKKLEEMQCFKADNKCVVSLTVTHK